MPGLFMNDLQDFIGLAGRLINKPEKPLVACVDCSEGAKTLLPYSSAKLDFVNNPGMSVAADIIPQG